MVSFIKSGAAASAAVKGERAKAEAREAKYEKEKLARKFFVAKGSHTDVTFLDGELYKVDADDPGILDKIVYEHNITPKGGTPGKDTESFICINEEQADEGKECPPCADGDTPRHMLLLTVIDHSEYTDKAGKKHKDEKRLFMATDTTQKTLELEATIRGGLTGCRYRATRENKNFEPRVGGTYTFLNKLSKEELVATYGEELTTPLDYEAVLPVYTQEELIKMGYGASIMNVSKEAATVADKVDVEKEL